MTLTIYEVIKELLKNPSKIFTVIDNKNIKVYVAKKVELQNGSEMHDCIVIKDTENGFIAPLCINDITKQYKFTEPKKPVHWAKALSAWKEGKTIYCICDDIVYTFYGNQYYLVDWTKDKILDRKLIEKGKWYIEKD